MHPYSGIAGMDGGMHLSNSMMGECPRHLGGRVEGIEGEREGGREGRRDNRDILILLFWYSKSQKSGGSGTLKGFKVLML